MSDNSKIAKATSWSFLTQLVSKIIPPVSNMILARFFAPEVFGVIATITMVTNFADTVSESGFQKYIISKKYNNKEELRADADVAFWTNLGISIFLWTLISIFSKPICNLLGSPGLEKALIVACIQLPLTSLSCIHIAVYHREYNFKRSFISQLISSLLTLVVTVGLAFEGYGYWAIIFGNIVGYVIRPLILSKNAPWLPRFYYSIQRLKNIFSFSMWIMIEAVAVWLTSWFDAFVIGNKLSAYNLGIYKNSQSVVNGLLAIPQNGITNVLLVILSKKTHDDKEFNRSFLSAQRTLAYILIPMGFGIFLYRDLAVKIVFGSGWEDAEFVIAVWALASIFRILLVSLNSAIYIAKGKPRISFYLQIVDIIILVPACVIGVKYGLEKFVVIRCIARLDIVIPSMIILYKLFGISFVSILKNLMKPLLLSLGMCLIGIMTKNILNSVMWQLASIAACFVSYVILFFVVAKEDFKYLLNLLNRRK